jgi:hypothetical protein
MSADPRLLRWTEDGSDAPTELQQWLRASRASAAAPDEIAELAQSLAQRLGPEAGLAAASRAPAVAGKAWLASGRWAAWLAAGAGSVAVVWYLASEPSRSAPAASAARAPAIVAPSAAVLPVAELPAPPVSERSEVAAAPELASPSLAPPGPAAPARARAPRAAAASNARARPQEAALLERAQSALATRPARALALTREHRRLFADGALVEEREAIAVEALRRLGREQEASQRAAVFAAQYPNSVHRSRVQATPVQR